MSGMEIEKMYKNHESYSSLMASKMLITCVKFGQIKIFWYQRQKTANSKIQTNFLLICGDLLRDISHQNV